MSPYKTFEEVCDYFNRLEDFKLLVDPYEGCGLIGDQAERDDIVESDDHPILQQQWGFIYHSHHKLLALLERLEEISFIQIVQEAYEEEFEMVEIFRGEAISEWIVIMPGLDENDVMRKWCLNYAFAHGFTILETFSEDVVSGAPKEVKG
jgi:uncharacterized protein YabN with tetrapyrrole methylase and pyrophosphatase domain